MTTEIANKFSTTRKVFPGIVRDSRRLGVTREHLQRVLTGKRISPGLIERYHQLKKTELELA